MLFNQITNQLLKQDNSSILAQGGALYIQDLHKFVNLCIKTVAAVEQPAHCSICKTLKENLYYILTGDDVKKLPLNTKRPHARNKR